MENPVVVAQRSYGVVSTSRHEPKSFSTLSGESLGKKQYWQFRLEKKVALRPLRKTQVLEVRAKNSGSAFKLPGTLKIKDEEPKEAASAKGTQALRKLSGTFKLPGRERAPPKDKNVVFVAGATGKVGRRVVRELVQLGFSVRAGVRDVDRAQFLFEFAADQEAKSGAQEEKRPSMWSNFAPEKIFGFLGSAKKEPAMELVEVDLEKSNPEDIEAALGNAGVIVCTIGASEKEALNVTGPYRIDFKATESLISSARRAKVNHFVLVTSLGTNKVGWPSSILNLFWGVLIWKAKAEKALIKSGIPFTIVRPGGMEKPGDAYKDTHNLILDKADSRFGGQVSSLQVAEVIAGLVSNLELAQDKVLEVVAETTAPLRTIEDLLAAIPSISSIATVEKADKKYTAGRKAKEEEDLKKQDELKARKEYKEQERLTAEREKTEALRQMLESEYMKAKQKRDEAKKEATSARLEKEEIERRATELRSKAEAAAQVAREAKALEIAIIRAARQAKKLSDKEKKDIVASVRAEIEAEVQEKYAKEKVFRDREENKASQEVKAVQVAKVVAEQKRKADAAKAVGEAKKVAEEEAAKTLKAEAEIRVKVEAEKKAKAEADIKAKEEAEVEIKTKAEDEAEIKAKVEAEAEIKVNAEADEKAKAEAEIKAKAEVEAKVKAEAEMKAKEEAEDKAKAEAEIKTKAEAAAKIKATAENEAKIKAKSEAKENANAKAKAEAVTKPSAETVESRVVEVVASGDVFKQKETAKPFRWPWQKDQPLEDKPVNVSPRKRVVEETSQQKSNGLLKSSRPLSPYAQYPGLKPPTSPTPPPKFEQRIPESAADKVEFTLSQPDKLQVQDSQVTGTPLENEAADGEDDEVRRNLAAQARAESMAREQGALRKAKSATLLLWPWQETELPTELPKPEAADTLEATKQADLGEVLAPPPTATKPTISQELPRPSRPLSPYSRYPGLKPLTSPTPLTPKILTKALAEEEVKKESGRQGEKGPPASKGYIDLKPQSPLSSQPSIPVNAGSQAKVVESPAVTAQKVAVEATVREEEALLRAKAATAGKFAWPWQKEEPKGSLDLLLEISNPVVSASPLPPSPHPSSSTDLP